ncbi:hypothetical protein MXB_448 [Myxobolus squamalis]|nr:hypothetical protein MXB_448 [Myxobolus squamalis]
MPYSKTEPIDLDKFLTQFIKEQYGDKTVSKFKNAIRDVHELRNELFLESTNNEESKIYKISE